MCIDMGTHLLQHIAGAQSLMQIAVPGLEERARWYPVLRSISLSPGGVCCPIFGMTLPLPNLLENHRHHKMHAQPCCCCCC